ncbi:MAG: polyprenyl synthetase family protein [Pseudomonadota bacterium]|nr:polyprenyl synthetase family protein [Pseudomonadota bacterium]
MSVVIDLDRGRKEWAKPSIEALTELTQTDIQKVNQTIIDHMESPVILIPQVAGHIIGAGGKRLRPMLTLAAARMCGYDGDRHIGLAACVEFIHTATLLHDDVVDDSDLRRGSASANAVWGNKSSVLVGDFLFSRAFELMVKDGDLDVLRILSEASSVIAEGEVLQLVTANDTETTEGDYLKVIRSKTAKLFAAACEIGPVVAGRSREEWKALNSFGHNIGMAFQLVDDVLDYSARQATLGKTVGDDFRDGKITLPVVLAFKGADNEEKCFWRRTMEDLEQKKGDFRRAVTLLENSGALSSTINQAHEFGMRANQDLDAFPDSEFKTALLEAVDFAIRRNY